MPNKALKTCAQPGCPTLVSRGFCAKHEQDRFKTANDRRPEWAYLYSSARWQKIRRMQLFNEPMCAECLKRGRFTPATECDHIHPHRGDPDRFYRGPFQSLCKPCHSRKTLGEVLGRGG